jgi:hypothetical protein
MLEQFDGLTLNMYVPDHYTSFGDPHIPRGNNFLSRVGHDFWASGELAAFFENNVKPHVLTARAGLSPEQELTCAIAGHLFPNRVPYLLGAIGNLSASR